MTLSCGSGKGRALIFIEGDIFFMSLYQIIPIFNKKITRKSFRNDFGNFCENVPTEFELQDSRQAEFSFHKLLMITHEISHHFCVDSRWNRQNCPILTLLKSRLTCRRFSEQGFISNLIYFFSKITTFYVKLQFEFDSLPKFMFILAKAQHMQPSIGSHFSKKIQQKQ